MKKDDIQKLSWYDVGSDYSGRAVNKPNDEYYAMLISEGIKHKFELRVARPALAEQWNADAPYSIYNWLWYFSLVIAQDMEETLPFHILTVNSSDLKDGKLLTPWRNLMTTTDKIV